jgi:hypothetical protein
MIKRFVLLLILVLFATPRRDGLCLRGWPTVAGLATAGARP